MCVCQVSKFTLHVGSEASSNDFGAQFASHRMLLKSLGKRTLNRMDSWLGRITFLASISDRNLAASHSLPIRARFAVHDASIIIDLHHFESLPIQ